MSVIGVVGISSGEVGRHASFYPELLQVRRPLGTVVLHSLGLYVYENRNRLTAQALKLGAEWIWYVDDDHRFAPDTLERLLAHNVSIVSGVYVKRGAPFTPLRYYQEDADGSITDAYFAQQDTGLKSVAAVGAGCLLVRRAVLDAIGPPHWQPGRSAIGDTLGEDVEFCRRVREKGFKIWCDFDTPVGHLATGVITPRRSQDGTWRLELMDLKGDPAVSWAAPQPSEVLCESSI